VPRNPLRPDYFIPDDRASLASSVAQLALRQTFRCHPFPPAARRQADPILGGSRACCTLLPSRECHLLGDGCCATLPRSLLQEQRITQLALHDALTQLPNRILLEDHLQQAIVRAQRNKTQGRARFYRSCHFSISTIPLGHNAGDKVLVTLSKRLQSVLRVSIRCRAGWG